MLDGVKALFRFTMAILYLAFQVTPPSSCEIFTTIRNTARDMYDIKLLLSIVDQIKLPRDSYFAIRRSFYMVQSSFNSDQFYMQTFSNDASRQLVSNKPLSIQQPPDTKPPAMSFLSAATLVAHQSFGFNLDNQQSAGGNSAGSIGPRVCTSADRTKVCVQNIGKLGRSHIKIIDANIKSNERSLMSPLRNCIVIGITNCGKNIVVVRQSSRRNFKTFKEQDLVFHVHELSSEIFDGFYLEDGNLALVLTHLGDIFKIDATKCSPENLIHSTESISLRDSQTVSDNERLKLRLASVDSLTGLLWVYVECEGSRRSSLVQNVTLPTREGRRLSLAPKDSQNAATPGHRTRPRGNNPFLSDLDEVENNRPDSPGRNNHHKRILILDIATFDLFSAFTLHSSFGEITKLQTSLVAFCQLSNPMSSQFSSRILRIGPTGHYEHLLSLSDVVDFLITVPDSFRRKQQKLETSAGKSNASIAQGYSGLKNLLIRSMSMSPVDSDTNHDSDYDNKSVTSSQGTLSKYYRTMMRRPSNIPDAAETSSQTRSENSRKLRCSKKRDDTRRVSARAILTSYLGDIEDMLENNYLPVNMVFIFRNGKIALFEFTESYAIHTRESQLDRYDYSKVIGVAKNGEDFIITILTVFDKMIKVVI